jgi:hypothetical protein
MTESEQNMFKRVLGLIRSEVLYEDNFDFINLTTGSNVICLYLYYNVAVLSLNET